MIRALYSHISHAFFSIVSLLMDEKLSYLAKWVKGLGRVANFR